jgi:hypothetical protein
MNSPPRTLLRPPPAEPPASGPAVHRPDPRKAEFEANKLRKRLRRLAGEAIGAYDLIAPHDRVMVCLSGGKDSYGLLDILLTLKGRAPFPFEVIAMNLDQKQPGFPPTCSRVSRVARRAVSHRRAGHVQRGQAGHPGGRDDVLAVFPPAAWRDLSDGHRDRRHQDRAGHHATTSSRRFS